MIQFGGLTSWKLKDKPGLPDKTPTSVTQKVGTLQCKSGVLLFLT